MFINLLLLWRLGWKRVVCVLSSVPSQHFLSVFWPCSKIWLYWLHRTVQHENNYVSNVWCVLATSWHDNRSVFSLQNGNHSLHVSFAAQTTWICQVFKKFKVNFFFLSNVNQNEPWLLRFHTPFRTYNLALLDYLLTWMWSSGLCHFFLSSFTMVRINHSNSRLFVCLFVCVCLSFQNSD